MIQHHLDLPSPWSAQYLHGTAADGARLALWMKQDYLVNTWDQAWTAERWAAVLHRHATSSDVSAFLVHHEAQPFAYIEVYELASSPLAEHGSWASGDMGFHIAVVEPRKLGRGLARRLVGDLCGAIFTHYGSAERIAVEPNEENKRIIRLLEHSGFTLIKTAQFPQKRAAVMVLPRPTG
ncbi:GNAT family N-acetyltransferase [Streptomyces anulatus]|uniref:GNAT family N-acetyltransferase n=1 Tax=Streptomyces anulatus TaxID=1892 RepID=UPI001C267B77